MTELIAAPAERPLTKTRAPSTPKFAFAWSTICFIESASP